MCTNKAKLNAIRRWRWRWGFKVRRSLGGRRLFQNHEQQNKTMDLVNNYTGNAKIPSLRQNKSNLNGQSEIKNNENDEETNENAFEIIMENVSNLTVLDTENKNKKQSRKRKREQDQ